MKYVLMVLIVSFMLLVTTSLFAQQDEKKSTSTTSTSTMKSVDKAVVSSPGKARYTCPSTKYINCMPPVEKSARDRCNHEYLEWAKGHCPGFKVVY